MTPDLSSANSPKSQDHRKKQIVGVTIVGMFSNIGLMVAKFVVGILGQSSAMVADALNSLSDIVTDLTMLYFVRLSCKPSDKGHRYGHGKYETLASACIAIAMVVLGGSLLAEAISTISGVIQGEKTVPTPDSSTLIVAFLTIVIKWILFLFTSQKGKLLHSSSLRAKAFDHRNDVLISLAVLIGVAAALFLGNQWAILEPIAAGVVSVIIIYTGANLLIPSIEELLEKSLPDEEEHKIRQTLQNEPSIISYHKLHTRTIGSRYAIEVDIRVEGKTSVQEAHQLTQKVEDKLREIFGSNTHVIIHVEPAEEEDRDADPF